MKKEMQEVLKKAEVLDSEGFRLIPDIPKVEITLYR